MQLWKKRLVLLLTIVLLGSEAASHAMVVYATGGADAIASEADGGQEEAEEKERLPIPGEYITFGEDMPASVTDQEKDQNQIAVETESAEAAGEVIPIITPDSLVEQDENQDAEIHPEITPETEGISVDGIGNGADAIVPEMENLADYPERIDVSTVSANTIEADELYTIDTNEFKELECQYMAFIPQESGYYSIVAESAGNDNVVGVVYSENGQLINSGEFNGAAPLTTYLDAGKQYIIMFDEIHLGISEYTYRVTKAMELQLNSSDFACGTIEDVAIVVMEPDCLGELSVSIFADMVCTYKCSIRTDKGLWYSSDISGQSGCGNVVRKRAVLTVVNTAEDNNYYEIATHFTPYQSYDASLQFDSIDTYDIGTYQSTTNGCVSYKNRKGAYVQYTPKESGKYIIVADSNVSYLRCSDARTDGEGDVCHNQHIASSSRALCVEMEEGKNYFINFTLDWGCEENTAVLSIQRQDTRQLELGQEYTLDIVAGTEVNVPVDKGKFYRCSIVNNNPDGKNAFSLENANYLSEHSWMTGPKVADTIYAWDNQLKLMIFSDIENTRAEKITVKIEECQPQVLEEGKAISNERTTFPREGCVFAFTPAETKAYTFYGMKYSERDYLLYRLFEEKTGTIYENENYVEKTILYGKGDVNNLSSHFSGTDELQIQYALEAGKKYYFCVSGDSGQIESGDIVVGVEPSKEYTYVFSDTSAKAEWDIPLNFGAKLQFNIPESGFYKVTVSGGADSYRFRDGNNQPFTVYNEQEKTFFAPLSDSYTLQIAREFKTDSVTDDLKVTIEKEELSRIPLYTTQNAQTLDITLREQEDYVWTSFTAEKTGWYALKSTYPDSGNDEDDDYYNVYTDIYKINGDVLQRDFMIDLSHMYLKAGETIYGRTTAYGNRGEVSLQMIPYTVADLKKDVQQRIQSDTGYVVLEYDLAESGIYRLDFAQDGKECYYNIMGFGNMSGYLYPENDVSLNGFCAKGAHQVFVTPDRPAGNTFTAKLAEETVYEEISEIPVKDNGRIWVKYTPDKTERRLIGIENTDGDYETDLSIYSVITDSYIEECSKYGAYDGNGYFGIADFVEGETYFVSISVYGYAEEGLPKSVTMYTAGVPEYDTQPGSPVSVDMSKVAYVNLGEEPCEIGWYQVTLEGLDGSYMISLGNKKMYNSKKINNDGAYYLYCNRKTKHPSLMIRRMDGAKQDSFTVTVNAYQPVPKGIELNETVSGVATNFDCYSFTVPKTGSYCLECEGFEEYRCQVNGFEDESWWSEETRTFAEGDVVTLFTVNQKGQKYSLKIYETTRKFVFDFDEYQAFIASGGSVTLKNKTEISDNEWDLYDSDEIGIYWYDDNQRIVVSNQNFKNPNQLWLLDYMTSGDYDVSYKTYDYFQTELKKQYGNTFVGLYKPNGQKPAGTDVVDPSYLLLAKIRPEFVWVQEIKISGVNALKVGASEKLTAVLDTKNQYEPTNAKVKWSSSDSSIVSVDQTGLITANKPGQATITVQSEDQLRKSASLKVTVSQDVVYVSKVVISGANKLYVGDEAVLTATLDTGGKGKPSRDGVTWASSDETVAKVDQTGKMTAVCAGTAVITAASNDGKASATYTITVENIEETKISLNESKIAVKKGTSYKWLTVTFNPENTTIKTLTWKSDNTKVATVNSKGVITAKGVGKATITVTSRNGKKDSVKVTVTKDAIKMKKITISSKETLYEGETLKLDAAISPVNTTNQKLKWTSSNEAVATVSSKGVVTAKKAGKATITVTAQDGTKKTDKCVITVKELPKVDGLKLSSKSKKTVELTWKEVKDADGYNIYMADSKNGKYRKIGTTKAGVTGFTKEKLTSKKKYYFKVAAYQKAGRKTYEGKFSSVKNVKVK